MNIFTDKSKRTGFHKTTEEEVKFWLAQGEGSRGLGFNALSISSISKLTNLLNKHGYHSLQDGEELRRIIHTFWRREHPSAQEEMKM